ncbi:MAG: glycosyltransferase family 2 protein [Methanobacteriaceae archaeon]
MDLSIIILNYNTYELSRNAINSIISRNHRISYEIFLVDNKSNDGSFSKLKNIFKDEIASGCIKTIASTDNNGFSAGNNLAIKEATGDYILLLNSDAVVCDNTLDNVLDYIINNNALAKTKKDKIGAIGVKVVLPNGELDKACKRSFPSPGVSFYRMTGLSFIFPKSKRFGKYNLTYLNEDEINEVDSLVGAFILVPRTVIDEVGSLSEDYFMYGEDIDWCFRIKEAGYKIIYYPKAKIIHYKGGSSKKSKKLIYEFHNAMYIFYKKHYADKYNFIVNGFVYTGIWISYLFKRIINMFK